jgi:DNA repair protein RadC
MSTGDLRTLRAQGKIAGRAYFGLRRVGVDRLSDLVGWSLSRIEAVPGIGEAAAREILELMQAAGMTVPTTPVPGIVVPADPELAAKTLRARFTREQLAQIVCALQEHQGRA